MVISDIIQIILGMNGKLFGINFTQGLNLLVPRRKFNNYFAI